MRTSLFVMAVFTTVIVTIIVTVSVTTTATLLQPLLPCHNLVSIDLYWVSSVLLL